MALDDYVRSPLGLFNVFAVLLNIAAILACGLQWTSGVSLQIIFTEHVWLSGAQFLFFGATLTMILLLILYSFPRTDTQNRISGGGLVFFLSIALLCELCATIVIIYYVMVDDRNTSFYMRFIFILIIAVLFIAVVIIMIIMSYKYLNQVWAIEPGNTATHHSAHKIIVTPNHTSENLERSNHHI